MLAVSCIAWLDVSRTIQCSSNAPVATPEPADNRRECADNCRDEIEDQENGQHEQHTLKVVLKRAGSIQMTKQPLDQNRQRDKHDRRAQQSEWRMATAQRADDGANRERDQHVDYERTLNQNRSEMLHV